MKAYGKEWNYNVYDCRYCLYWKGLRKPFPQEDELRTKSARLAELNAELNIDDRTPMEQLADRANDTEIAKSERPSVLEKLKGFAEQTQGQQRKKHELEER